MMSIPVSALLAAFSPIMLRLVVMPLVPHLLPAAGGDAAAARDEALAMIAGYDPGTYEELRLAAQASGFGLQVGAVLQDLGKPHLTEAAILTLRRTAAIMQRSELSTRRLLSTLQRQRRQAAKAAAERPDGMATADANAEPVAEPDTAPASAPPRARVIQPASSQPASSQSASSQPAPGQSALSRPAPDQSAAERAAHPGTKPAVADNVPGVAQPDHELIFTAAVKALGVGPTYRALMARETGLGIPAAGGGNTRQAGKAGQGAVAVPAMTAPATTSAPATCAPATRPATAAHVAGQHVAAPSAVATPGVAA